MGTRKPVFVICVCTVERCQRMMEILRNKVIIVVGASSGIGAAMSDYFSEKGAIVCVFARRGERNRTSTLPIRNGKPHLFHG